MTDPYFNLQSLSSDFQTAYDAVMYGSRLSSNDCVQKKAVAFGQQVKQTSPNDYLNTSVPDEHEYHNQFSYFRFRLEVSENLPSSTSESSDGAEASGAVGNIFTSPPKHTPITTLDFAELCQDETSEVSVKSKKADSSESEIKFVQVGSMATEEGSHFANNSHQYSNIQTSPIIQADNLANEFARSCFTQNNAVTGCQGIHKGEKPYKCKDCDKGFAKKCNLKTHQRIHSGEKPYKCSDCGRGFSQQATLESHLRIHSGEKPYKCKECDRGFAQRTALKAHLRIHTGERPYKCKNCDKCFVQSGGLLIHQRTHLGKKPYECKLCLKSFAQRVDLEKHQRIHTGEKPFQCEQCNRRFTQKSHLKSHRRTHTPEKPHECKQCGMCFAKKHVLRTHQHIHKGEKLYKCNQCDKLFARQRYLKAHEHIHTDVKPYKCGQCDKCFTMRRYLIIHQRVHAGKSLMGASSATKSLPLEPKPGRLSGNSARREECEESSDQLIAAARLDAGAVAVSSRTASWCRETLIPPQRTTVICATAGVTKGKKP